MWNLISFLKNTNVLLLFQPEVKNRGYLSLKGAIELAFERNLCVQFAIFDS